MDNIKWERLAAVLFCILAGGIVLYLGARFLLPVLIPFVLGWLLSLGLARPVEALSRRLHLSRRVTAASLIALTVGGGAWGLWIALQRLGAEAGRLARELLADGGLGSALESGRQWLVGVAEHFGVFSVWAEENTLSEMITKMLGGVLGSLGTQLSALVTGVIARLPSFFFVVVLTVIAGYWFCVDGCRIRRALTESLPESWRARLRALRRRGKEIFAKYCKAYLQLLLLTFAALLFGLLFLRVEAAFLLALLISLLDLLPVIGVGTVMIPWSLLLLITRNYYLGFGILILYLAVELLRQIAEPRLLGKHLGVHPLLTLFSTYAGFCLFGVVGMLLAPFAAVGIKTLFGEKTGDAT